MENLGVVFLSEVVGTAMLVLLGCGVVANVALAKTKGLNGGFLMVTFGWGFAVFAGVIVAYNSGAHLNPAVTLGLVANGVTEFGSGVEVNITSILVYILAQFLGAFIGAVVTWLSYKQHFDDEPEAANKLGVFSPGPAIRNVAYNLTTEIVGTFELGPLAVALVVVGVGLSLGGPTGYAINPARDLGPRIAHALLPIKGKGSSDWGYAWIPVVGPVIGGVLAGLLAIPLLPLLT